MLPGYAPVSSATASTKIGSTKFPATPGLNLLQMMDAAKDGKLKALYVVGSNPVARYNIDPFALSKSFVIVQDMFLTETAASRRRSAAGRQRLRKGWHLHQHLRRCADAEEGGRVLGRAQRFRMHCAHRAPAWDMTFTSWCPSAAEARAPTWARRRGAQSGEADRHAVWLSDRNLEPKMSPYDPTAMLDEIQRLVPGYDISRLGSAARATMSTRSWCRLPAQPAWAIRSWCCRPMTRCSPRARWDDFRQR